MVDNSLINYILDGQATLQAVQAVKDKRQRLLRWMFEVSHYFRSSKVTFGQARSRYSDVNVKYTHGLYIIVKNDHKISLEKGHRGL